jgi:transcriptional regulator of acetoin/glycerol metabolism
VPGRLFTESTTGTNSIATALEIRQGIAVHGDEHYLEHLRCLSCYGAPIIDRLSRRVEGVLDITCLARDDTGLLRPFLVRAAREIEGGLLAGGRRSHRRVLAAFETAAANAGGALLAFDTDLVLANDEAQDLLEPVDQAALRSLAAGTSTRRSCETELASGARVTTTIDPVHGGGVLIALRHRDRAHRVVPRRRRASHNAVGMTDWYADMRNDLGQYRTERASVIVHGEPGSRRGAVALDIVGAEKSVVLAGDDIDLSDVRRACAQLTAVPVGALVINRAHLLAPAVASHLVGLLTPHDLRLVLTADSAAMPGEIKALAAHCPVRVQLPPLRVYRGRIPALAAAMLRERSAGATRFTPTALRALASQNWPGNLRELASVVGYVAGHRSTGDITVADLPPGYRGSPREPVAGALWQAERDVIIRALVDCGGNKVHAAQHLGISRNMLYRRLRGLHIADTDWTGVPNANS